MMATGNRTHPMKGLVEEWLKKIKIAQKVKWERFGQYAEEAYKFYNGAHDWMWNTQYSQGKGGFLSKDSNRSAMPTFRMTVNRVFEAVALFGPALYHQYPNVMVTTVKPPVIAPEALGFNMLGVDTSMLQNMDPMTAQSMDPMQIQELQMAMQQQQAYQELEQRAQYEEAQKSSCASVKQHLLNWIQVEGNKKIQSRRSITECIVKGAGYLMTELYQPRGSQRKYPRSVHVSCDDILKDPDASYHEDVQWVAIRRFRTVSGTLREFGLNPEDLKGHKQSFNSQVTPAAKKQARNNKENPGESFDMIEYYEIYSKNGFGDRLKATDKIKSKYSYEQFGDFCRIVVASGVDFPLNMPTWSLQEPDDALFLRSQWPIPYWTDEGCGNGWPFAELGFYEDPGCVWPISLIKPAIGELRFVNWCMSFLADKVAASCVTYVAVLKDAAMEIQDSIKNKMAPFTVLELSQIFGKSISEVVSFLEAPSFAQDIWKMVAEVLDLIDKRTGLTDLVYGLTGTQIRSAQEAQIKDQNTNIRPDDMASKTEDWLSESAMKEIEAAAWGCSGEDFATVLGEQGTYIWDTYVKGQDFENIVRDYKYRIEAGSARKPNKANRLRSLAEFSQMAMPGIQEQMLIGNVGPWNALMKDYGEAMDLDPSGYLIEPPPAANGPTPEEMQAEMEMKKMELELQIKQEEQAMKAEEHQMDLAFKREEHIMDMQMKSEEMEQKTKEFQLTLDFERTKAKEQTKVMKETTKAKKEQAEEMGKIKIDSAKAQAEAKAKAKPVAKASKA
jgi:hypothetical protein